MFEVEQAIPQPPQLVASVVVLTSQPSPTCLSQSAKPAVRLSSPGPTGA